MGPPGRGARGHSLISMLWNKERLQLHVQETLGCPAAAVAVLLTPIKRCMDGVAAQRGAQGARGRPGGGSGRRPVLGPRMQKARGGEGAPRLAGLGTPPSFRGAAGLSERGRTPRRPPAAPPQPRGRRQCPRVASGKWAGSRGARCRRG